jgi:hypothetical protein
MTADAGGPPDQVERKQDARTAVTTGAGIGLGMLGVLAVPVLSFVGVLVSYLGWRSARPQYATGRVAGMVGMVVGFIGVALLVVEVLRS